MNVTVMEMIKMTEEKDIIHAICEIKEFLSKKIVISLKWENTTENPTKMFWEGQRLAFEETLKKIEEEYNL